MNRKVETKTINFFSDKGENMNNDLIATEILNDTSLTKNHKESNCNTVFNSRRLADYPDVLTPVECQNILLVGRNTIYSLLKDGIIKSIKIGKQYRIPKSSLQNYLDLCYNSDYIDNSASA